MQKALSLKMVGRPHVVIFLSTTRLTFHLITIYIGFEMISVQTASLKLYLPLKESYLDLKLGQACVITRSGVCNIGLIKEIVMLRQQ